MPAQGAQQPRVDMIAMALRASPGVGSAVRRRRLTEKQSIPGDRGRNAKAQSMSPAPSGQSAKAKREAAAPKVKRTSRAGHPECPSHLCTGFFAWSPAPGKRLHKKSAPPRNLKRPPCVFSTAKPGTAARKSRGSECCRWCAGRTTEELSKTHVKTNVMAALKAFRLHDDEQEVELNAAESVYRQAKARLPEEFVGRLDLDTHTLKRKHRARRVRAPVDWTSACQERRSTMAPPSRQRKKEYRSAVLEDQRRAQKMVLEEDAPRRKRARGEALYETQDNSTGLPRADYSDLSRGLQAWCEHGSWGMCPECRVLQPRPMKELDLERDPQPDIAKSACKRCNSKAQYMVPKPEDVPKELCGLSEEAIEALRPLDVDVGEEKRSTTQQGVPNGYRQKNGMIRFSYSEKKPMKKIKKLEDEAQRELAKKAYKFLSSSKESSYKKFLDLRLAFFKKNPKAEERQRLRQPSYLEQIGLECAVWPHLYWKEEMCESYIRSTDVRRQERQVKQFGDESSSNNSECKRRPAYR